MRGFAARRIGAWHGVIEGGVTSGAELGISSLLEETCSCLNDSFQEARSSRKMRCADHGKPSKSQA